MARELNGTGDKIETSTLPSTATNNVTFGGWFYFVTLDNDYGIILHNGGLSAGYGIFYYHSFAEVMLLVNGTFKFIGGVVTTGEWMQLTIRLSSGTWSMWRDGVKYEFDDTTVPNTPSGTFQCGYSGGGTAFNVGFRAAECFFYTAALSNDEIWSLGKGFSPLLVRPASLVLHWPLMGRISPEPDLRSGNSGTVTGTTAADHPPKMIYPRRLVMAYPFTSGASGTDLHFLQQPSGLFLPSWHAQRLC